VRYEEVEAWVRLAADRLREQRETLTALDQAIGDGDHGINMERGFSAVVARLDQPPTGGAAASGEDGRSDPAALLRLCGRTLIGTVGGAAGPLYGTAFLRAAGAVDGRIELGAAEFLAALDAAVAGIAALGKASVGEKTMLDALVPALEAARGAAAAGRDGSTVVSAASEAAHSGARATIPMLATKGRASYLGERSIGHQDPGATSASLLLRALADVATGRAR
jgi:dihydroxyacetone kinase-like protein